MGRKGITLSKKYKHRSKRKQESLIKQVKRLIREPKRNVEKSENAIVDVSPAHAMLDMMEEFCSPPEQYIPNIEYVQKNDDTPLPVGNLQTFFRDLSRQARIAWNNWIQSLPKPIEKMLFDSSEENIKRRYRRVALVEDKKWLLEQEERARRAISESFGLETCKIPDFNNYNGSFKNPVGADRVRYSPSHADRARLAHQTEFETNIARKNSLKDQDHLLANCGPDDDPDHMLLGDVNRPFNCLKPASRPYNCVYKVYRLDGKEDILYPNKKAGKDYTAEKDIIYMYQTKGIPIKYEDGVPKIVRLGPDKFELDIRVTKGGELDPRNYKKIDPQSPAGIKIADMIDGQPHLWTENSWEHIENGNIQKKVAWSLTIPHNSGGVVTIWFYMDDRFVNRSTKRISIKDGKHYLSFIEKRKVKPHIRYIEQKCSYWLKRPLYANLVAELVYHRKFKRFAEEISKKLQEDYTFVKSSKDLFDVVTDLYVRNDALSKKDRDRFVLCEDDWKKKYASS